MTIEKVKEIVINKDKEIKCINLIEVKTHKKHCDTSQKAYKIYISTTCSVHPNEYFGKLFICQCEQCNFIAREQYGYVYNY